MLVRSKTSSRFATVSQSRFLKLVIKFKVPFVCRAQPRHVQPEEREFSVILLWF